MTDLTDSEHGELVRARLAAATPGPWWNYERDFRGEQSHSVKRGDDYVLAFVGYSTLDSAVSGNADLIANAPTDLARLLARAEKAERERDEWKRKAEAAERAGAVKALEALGWKQNAAGNCVTASVIFGEADLHKNGAPL